MHLLKVWKKIGQPPLIWTKSKRSVSFDNVSDEAYTHHGGVCNTGSHSEAYRCSSFCQIQAWLHTHFFQIIFLLVRFPTDTGSGNLAIFILFLVLFDLNFQRLDFLHQIWQEKSYLEDLQCQAGQVLRPTHQQMCSTRRTLKEHCVFIFVSVFFFGNCLCLCICAYFPPGCQGRCRWWPPSRWLGSTSGLGPWHILFSGTWILNNW